MAKADKIDVRLELDEDGHWCAQVETLGLEGCITDARTLRRVRERVREVLGMEWGDDARAARAMLAEHIVVSQFADEALRKALEARADAEVAAENAKAGLIKAVRILSEHGLGTRDTGELLNLSQARVAQLLRSA